MSRDVVLKSEYVGVLVGHVLPRQTHLGVAGGQGLPHLVPPDDAESVVGPRRHGHLEGGGRGGDEV